MKRTSPSIEAETTIKKQARTGEFSPVNSEGLYAFFARLATQTGPISITISGRQITAKNIGALALVLNSIEVVKLDLSGNNLSAYDAFHLTNILETNKTLTHLCLNENRVSNLGVAYLSELLKTNKILQVLELRGNSIGYKGAIIIAKALKLNYSLSTLDLSHNPLVAMNNEFNETLSSLFKCNASLQALKIHPLSSLSLERYLQRNIILSKNLASPERSVQFLETIELLDPNLKHRIKTKTITPPPLRMLAILALNPDQLSTIKKCVQNDYTLPCAINALSSSPDATIHAQTSDGLTILPEDTQSLSRH